MQSGRKWNDTDARDPYVSFARSQRRLLWSYKWPTAAATPNSPHRPLEHEVSLSKLNTTQAKDASETKGLMASAAAAAAATVAAAGHTS